MAFGRWAAVLLAAAVTACGKGREAGSAAASGGAPSRSAQGQADEPDEPESDGRALYRRACVMCHGERGRGTFIGPALNDHARDLASIEAAVRDGVAEAKPPHTPMPPRGDGTYTDAQVRTVAEYVRSLAR